MLRLTGWRNEAVAVMFYDPGPDAIRRDCEGLRRVIERGCLNGRDAGLKQREAFSVRAR